MVNYAKKELEDKEHGFDRVYCVFDRDEHPEFKNALKSAQAINEKLAKRSIQFKAIPSNPCFEIWFLLHFESLTDKEITSCNLQKKLKKYLPNYEKNAEGVFQKLLPKLKKAVENAKELRKDTTEMEFHELRDYIDKKPYTTVDKVVEDLIKLGEQQKN